MKHPEYQIEKDPLIVCGCGGGGTSFIAKLLRHKGLFMGADAGPLDARKWHESRAMKEINTVAYRHYGFQRGPENHYLKGDAEQNIKSLIQNISDKEKRSIVIERLKMGRIGSLGLVGFSIPRELNIFWGSQSRDVLWGWKDPKNSFMLPLWKDLFPGAKILMINKELVKSKVNSGEGRKFKEEMTDFVRQAHMSPPWLEEWDGEYLTIDFDEVCTSVDKFNEMCEFAGLQPSTEEEYKDLLKECGLEVDQLKEKGE